MSGPRSAAALWPVDSQISCASKETVLNNRFLTRAGHGQVRNITFKLI